MASVFETAEGYRLEFGDLRPFGHELVAAANGTDSIEVAERAQALQGAVVNLVSSPLEEDKLAAAEINWAYNHTFNDNNHMPDKADRPNGALAWLATADVADLIAFTTENHERHEAAGAEFGAYLPQLQASVMRAIDWLIEQKHAPKSTSSAMQRTMGRVGSLAVMDRFDTFGYGARGLHRMGTNQIALSKELLINGYLSDELIYTATHEYFHAIGDFAAAGLLWNEAKNPQNARRVLEESTVTYATLAALGTDPLFEGHSLAGSEYWEDMGGYRPTRKLLSLLADRGAFVIPPEDFVEAFFSPERFGPTHRALLARVDIKIRELLPEFKEGGLEEFSKEHASLQGKAGQSAWIRRQIEIIESQTASKGRRAPASTQGEHFRGNLIMIDAIMES